MICNLGCDLHTISSNFAKYEHILSKMKEEFVLQALKLSIYDLDLWLQSHNSVLKFLL